MITITIPSIAMTNTITTIVLLPLLSRSLPLSRPSYCCYDSCHRHPYSRPFFSATLCCNLSLACVCVLVALTEILSAVLPWGYAMCAAFYTDVYSYISRIGSSLFLVVQVLVLLDFAFSISEGMIERAAAKDSALDAAGYVPGFCQNHWYDMARTHTNT
jgi:hypothetical protein